MIRHKGVDEAIIRDVRTGWRQVVRDMGGVDATAKVVGCTISQVSVYGKIDGDSLPSLATILAAEIDLGRGHVTEAMARATGHILVPLEPIGQGELAELLSKVGAETGEVFARFAAALSNDGVVDAAERHAIARELQDLKRATLAALSYLQGPPTAVAMAAADEVVA